MCRAYCVWFCAFGFCIAYCIWYKMESRKYSTIETFLNSNKKIEEIEANQHPLTHKYMIADIPGLVQTLQ